MSHLTQSHSDLLARSRRIAGQVGAVDRALLSDKDCAEILHLVAAVRGAVNGMLADIIVHQLEVDFPRSALLDAAPAPRPRHLHAVTPHSLPQARLRPSPPPPSPFLP